MLQGYIVRCLAPVLAISLGLVVVPVACANVQETFGAAKSAYKSRDEKALAKYASALQSENYLLAPYLEYWRFLLRLEKAEPEEVQAFLQRYAEFPFAERVRGEWLKILGKRQQWGVFFSFYAPAEKEDVAVTCYAAQGRFGQGQASALVDARPVWMTGADQPSACDGLFELMQVNGVLTEDDVWSRMRLAFQANRVTVARSATRYLGVPVEAARLKQFDKVFENPQRMLEKRQISLDHRVGRELALYALERLVRTQPALGLELWGKYKESFSRDEQRYAWGRYALHLARRHDPQAMAMFGKAEGIALDAEQLAWKARTALRSQDWDGLLDVVAAMSPEQQGEQPWIYWKARALKTRNNIAGANALLVGLATQRSFYGLLALEELGDALRAPPTSYRASEPEIVAVKAAPGIQRAMELYQLDMRWEAKTEWQMATRLFDDKQLLAAAELAFRQEWYDVAILTAEKTALTHDFALRYPTPYRDMMESYVRENQLDEAWVYGLIRQESRFVSFARSGAGAAGLMQVMPATAKWIARRIGMDEYHPGLINRVETNIQLGTYYLKHVLDVMSGQPLMATAAYNAGPGRPKRWLDAKPMEGAVYAETIPFTETRDYVQKVMANTHFYAQRLGVKLQTFRQRIGEVAGAESYAKPPEETP